MKRTTVLVCLCFLTQIAPLFAEDRGCSPGELRTDSTPNCISIEWDVVGDANHDAACTVQYRPKDSKQWQTALSLLRVDYRWWYHDSEAEQPFNMLAGSIMFLQPDTTYELRLQLTDPDGGNATKTRFISTRSLPQRSEGGRMFHVVPGSGGGSGVESDPFQGVPAAQKAARAGDIFLLHKGSYGTVTVNKSGQPGKHVVWQDAGDGDAVFDNVRVEGSHVWLEGLRLKRTSDEQKVGLRAVGKTKGVVVRETDFQGFHYSVFLSPQSRNWHISDNVIVGDNDPVTGGIGGEGIELNHSGGHVVAFNEISQVADGVSYPERNVDIFGNDIFDVSDDGLESDRGYANVRMWSNRITNAKNNAISFQPMRCGPWYIVRNLVIGKGSTFKFRVQDRFVLINNTLVRWGSIGGRMHHMLTALSRNNLFISADGSRPVWEAYDCNSPKHCLPDNYVPTWMTDVDYDGFDWGESQNAFRWENNKYFPDLASFAEAVGIEEHGIRVRKKDIFKKWDIPVEPTRVSPQHLPLKKGSGAVDAGAVVPNIGEDYVGQAPDLGAYEHGQELPHYGPRSP